MRIDRDDAIALAGLLSEISRDASVPEAHRAAAAYWSSAVHREIESHYLEAIMWILRDASIFPQVPQSTRERCRYWATYLEGRLAS